MGNVGSYLFPFGNPLNESHSIPAGIIPIGLRVSRQVRSLGDEQTISVLVGAALPWTSRVAEVNLYAGRQAKLFIGAELLAPCPFCRLVWIEGAEAALS